MATHPLQNESSQANPLTLWDAALKLEDLEASAQELASLIFIASSGENVEPQTREAMRATGTLAELLTQGLRELAKDCYSARAAERGENITEFIPKL